MHALLLVIVILVPVLADRHDGAGRLVDGDDVGTCDVIVVVKPLRHDHLDMHLEEHVAVVAIAGVLDALKGVVLLLDVTLLEGGLRKLNVTIEAARLQLHDLGLGLPHDVRVPLAVGQV